MDGVYYSVCCKGCGIYGSLGWCNKLSLEDIKKCSIRKGGCEVEKVMRVEELDKSIVDSINIC